MKSPDAPRLAVVLPVFKHSVLVEEAIVSALDQDTDVPYRIVIVNDGCPFPETHRACLDFALAHPERIDYVRRRNGGLSCARNTGVRHVLNRYPTASAVYFLDADNRIRSTALGKAFACLEQHQDADWIYPNIDMFGMPLCCKYPGAYSLLIHSFMNISEAGSLVHRRVFEAGVFFDESMRLGYEDWEFWLQAARHGFRGRHLPDFGFLYRKRPESMLANSYRDDAEIQGYIRRKHRWLFNPRSITALEQQDIPRYAIFLADKGVFRLATDPALPGREMDVAAFEEACWRQRYFAPDVRLPGFVVVTDETVLDHLAATRLLHYAFWRMESDLDEETVQLSGLEMAASEDAGVLREHGAMTPGNAPLPGCGAVMLRAETLLRGMVAGDPHACASLLTDAPAMAMRHNVLQADAPDDGLYRRGVYDLVVLWGHLMHSRWRNGALRQRKQWFNCSMPTGSDVYIQARKSAGIDKPLYPRLVRPGERHVGYLLPVASFGGVEKVAYSVASALKKHNFIPHLFVMGQREIKLPDWVRDIFESVNLFTYGPEAQGWDGEGYRYYGTCFTKWHSRGAHGAAIGQFAWLDAVINGHCAESHAIMGSLRRLGVYTVNHVHVLDNSAIHRHMGHPFMGVAFENAYELMLTVSRQMRDWCHGMGIPGDKLLHVPNGPGYPMTPEAVQAILQARPAPRGRKLRVLSLGRLDAQKGLDTMVEFVRQMHAARLPVELRLVGDTVIDARPASRVELEPYLEPPVWDAAALSELYGWADVLLMFSKWEGLPLTVLEAMRLGVVVLATDVGAMAEAVEHGVTGFLLGDQPDRQAMAALNWLAENPEALLAMGREAARRIGPDHWQNACAGLAERLQHDLEKRRAAARCSNS